MLKKIMLTVVTAGLLLGSLQAKSLRDVLGSSLDQMNAGVAELNLAAKQLTEITPQEGELLAKNYPNLISLYLSFNLLKRLPEPIGDLTKLTYLGLRTNQLTSMPESIGDLINLKELSLGDNLLSPQKLVKIRAALPRVKIYGADNQRSAPIAMRRVRSARGRRLARRV